jgi:hypothetical protein
MMDKSNLDAVSAIKETKSLIPISLEYSDLIGNP